MSVRDVLRALTITFFACVVLAVGLQAASRWTLAFLVSAGRTSAQAGLASFYSAWPLPRVNAVLRILGGAFAVLAGIALALE